MTAAANLIWFQSDNHNHALLGCAGHPIVQTPAIDRIAARGTRFDATYCASPLCCPARAALATGRFPHQTGYWDNAHAYDGRVPSWMARLREQGHTVVSIGKLHYRSKDDDHGLSEEIVPLHGVPGVTGMNGLLRHDGGERAEPERWWEVYAARSQAGETEYLAYDRAITAEARQWLARHGRGQGRPWVLLVSYVSPHPPFTAPARLFDLYPPQRMPLPVAFRPGERPEHPADRHLRRIYGWREMTDEALLRRVLAGYCALITHLDEQIGAVLEVADELGLLEGTRILYTSDHGESYGRHGFFGKNHLYDDAVRVPLVVAGAGVPSGHVARALVSHVDLFPTVVAGVGAALTEEDADLLGRNLLARRDDQAESRDVFAEYHGSGSRNGMFMLRRGTLKLIYHANMAPQLFDLAADPDELDDLMHGPRGPDRARALESALRAVVDPEDADLRAKRAQRAMAARHGGPEAITQRPNFMITTPPTATTESGQERR